MFNRSMHSVLSSMEETMLTVIRMLKSISDVSAKAATENEA